MAGINSTRKALNGCLDAIRDGGHLSDNEARAGRRMFDDILEFCRDYGIIDTYDSAEIEELFDELSEKGDEDDE